MNLIENTLGELLEKWAFETPDHEFIVYPDRNLRFTYSQFNDRVDKMAKGLISIGVKQTIRWECGPQMYRTGLHLCSRQPKLEP